MRDKALTALLVVAVLGGSAMGYLFGSVGGQTVTSTSTATRVATTTATRVATINEQSGFVYLSYACEKGGNTTPCFGGPAHVFNACPHAGTGTINPHTCSYTLESPFPPYGSVTFNITLPVYAGPGGPSWASCWIPAAVVTGYADCIAVANSTAFIVGIPAADQY